MPDPNPPTPPTTPPATPAATPTFFIKPDGSYIEKFWEHPAFPAELKDNMQLRTHKNVADTYKNWASLHSRDGLERIALPGKSADQATWDETVWKRLGTPEAPEKYTLPTLADAGLDASAKAPDEVIQEVLKVAHGARLTDWQFGQFMAGWNKLIGEQNKMAVEVRTRAETELLAPLKAEWKGQFDGNAALALEFARTNIPAADFARLEKAGLLKDPAVLKLFHSLRTQLGEAEPDLTRPVPADVSAAADSKIRAMQADLKGPLYNADHPQHAEVMAEFKRLADLLERARTQRSAT